MSLQGELTTFTCNNFIYPIFTSGDLASERAVLFIGGLTNGIGGVAFTYPLSAALKGAGWRLQVLFLSVLVQFHWSSAFGGYGTGSLDRDREEMQTIVKHLKSKGVKTVVIMGHSTGSQNVMHYLSSPSNADPSADIHVVGGIMQASVSDREFCKDEKHYNDTLPLAQQWIKEGRGDDILPKAFCDKAGFGDVPMLMSAYRLHSLIGIGGDDDYFSADIPSNPTPPFTHSLSSSFGALTTPALALYAEGDAKYQVAHPTELLPRWAEAAKGKLQWRILEGASHGVEEEGPQGVLCEEVLKFVKQFE
ncbi:hypothetical protein B9479_005569 [Cryptococcus floricola]|uniref:Dolichol-phosphate mannosyltransferase n=1 Tax=Cryptococcus floricola TaxID=2591691 RepID=A0A5D3ASW9_9TREE|nr:hypothetical protein B9479_005569 [Cryptococcus floricola]